MNGEPGARRVTVNESWQAPILIPIRRRWVLRLHADLCPARVDERFFFRYVVWTFLKFYSDKFLSVARVVDCFYVHLHVSTAATHVQLRSREFQRSVASCRRYNSD